MKAGKGSASTVASGEMWHEETEAARTCRQFHDRVRPTQLPERRAALAEFLESYYRDRLRIVPTPEESQALHDLTQPDVLAVEIGHDGQLPHLGIVRMVLKAHDIASRDTRALTLYAIGTHYTARSRPRNVHFGMPLEGRPPEEVGEPPKVLIGQENGKRPFWSIPPPKPPELRALEAQLQAFVGHNVAHERKAGNVVTPDRKALALHRLAEVFQLLVRCAEDVSNFGEWLVRVQHDLFRWLLGDEAGRILFLPMAEVVPLMRDDLRTIAASSRVVARIKSEAARERHAGSSGHDLATEATGPFWLYCPSCLRRERAAWDAEASIPFRCPNCGHTAELDGANPWPWLAPDVVSFQAALFQFGVAGWVVGSRASYLPVVDRVATEVFRREPPPRFLLRSTPMFRGLGDPPSGYGRTRLLRALLDIEPRQLAHALRAPWNEDPRIVGDLLRTP